ECALQLKRLLQSITQRLGGGEIRIPHEQTAQRYQRIERSFFREGCVDVLRRRIERFISQNLGLGRADGGGNFLQTLDRWLVLRTVQREQFHRFVRDREQRLLALRFRRVRGADGDRCRRLHDELSRGRL